MCRSRWLPPERMSLLPGFRFGPYEVLSLLGAGGMGEVYRARDTRLAREVAIKIIDPAAQRNRERLRRFEDEARAASALNHPNVVTVFDIGIENEAPYVVLELLEGETLREKLRSGALPVRKAVDYAVQVCHGLAAAHGKGIVHRDLKPENLFVIRDGRIKILDFGLARLSHVPDEDNVAGDQATRPVTEEGMLIGTFGYMSPEQARGQRADARSDIFALGAVMYEMLSGQPAFLRSTAAETLSAILSHDPNALSTASESHVPAALSAIIRRCVEKNADERFQSSSDLGFALSSLSGSTSDAALAPPAKRARRLLRAAVIGGAAVLVLVLVSLMGQAWWERPVISFQRLTFRRGTNWGARFAPDGQTVVYAAVWDGGPIRLFSTRLDNPESKQSDSRGGRYPCALVHRRTGHLSS